MRKASEKVSMIHQNTREVLSLIDSKLEQQDGELYLSAVQPIYLVHQSLDKLVEIDEKIDELSERLRDAPNTLMKESPEYKKFEKFMKRKK